MMPCLVNLCGLTRIGLPQYDIPRDSIDRPSSRLAPPSVKVWIRHCISLYRITILPPDLNQITVDHVKQKFGWFKFWNCFLTYVFQVIWLGWTPSIDIKVSRLAIVCPCLFKIMILCYSPRPKSGWKLGYVWPNQIKNLVGFSKHADWLVSW